MEWDAAVGCGPLYILYLVLLVIPVNTALARDAGSEPRVGGNKFAIVPAQSVPPDRQSQQASKAGLDHACCGAISC